MKCCNNRFWLITSVILMLLVSTTIFSASQDKAFMNNGEILNGRFQNEYFEFSTNYGNLKIPPRFIISIEFSNRGCKITTIYNEYISGHLKSPFLKLDLGGMSMNLPKENMKRIYIVHKTNKKKIYNHYFEMKNGDKVYGKILNDKFFLTTSYGKIDIDFNMIMKIEDLKGQTKVYLKNSNIMQGFIATPFLKVKLNYGPSIEIPKSSIKIVDTLN